MGEGLVTTPCLIQTESSGGTKTRMGEIRMGIKNGTVDRVERRIERCNVHVAWVMGPRAHPAPRFNVERNRRADREK